jgi:RimJ/RimL family protein N-acetyltransferase
MNIPLESVVLRRPEPRDVDQLYEFRNDWSVARSLGGFSLGYSRRDLEEWIEFHRNCRDEVIWTIAAKNTDLCIGHAGLYRIDFRVRCAEFAIVLGQPCEWGHGTGAIVSQAVIEYAQKQLNLRRISLSVLESNTRAIRLYERAGFTREGLLRDADFRDGAFGNVVLMALMLE